MMTARTIAFLALSAAILCWVFVVGHHRGRRSRRFDHRDGYLEGVRAEAARWEKVTGVPFGRLQAWRTGRGPDPFANLAAETEVLPSAEVLLAEADAALGKVPSVAEVDTLAAEWDRIHPGWREDARRFESARAPVVASVTDAARWYRASQATVTAITGRVVTPGRDSGNGWDRAAGLPDYAAAALGGHRTVDELVDSIVHRWVVKP